MRNLDKVWTVWQDLDVAHGRTSKTKHEFLRSLIADGSKEQVTAVLAKIANDVVTAEDNKKFAAIQSGMLALLNNFDQLGGNISSIQEYVSELSSDVKTTALQLDELLELMSVGRHYVIPSVDFEASPIGVELITADSIHKVNLVSSSAVLIPRWCENASELELTGSSFHRKISKKITKPYSNKSPVLFLDGKAAGEGKDIVFKNTKPELVFRDISVEVVII